MLGLAALAIPGIGPIVAAGPMAAALTGAGIGAAAGGMLGSLVELGCLTAKRVLCRKCAARRNAAGGPLQ
jgi:hypothetical protein